jgi:hypothetical protein
MSENQINYKAFKTSQLRFKTNNGINQSNMRMIFCNDISIKTPWIQLSQYGIPKKDKYNNTDVKRAYIQLPLDQNTKESKDFLNMLILIDNMLLQPEFKEQQIKDNWNEYTYSPLVKTPDDQKYLPNVKLKFRFNIDENNKLTMNTEIYNQDDEEVEFESIDKLRNQIKYKSNVKLLIKPAYLWIMKSNKTYGLTMKVEVIKYKPLMKSWDETVNE